MSPSHAAQDPQADNRAALARFAGFLGQPPIRATLTWILSDHHITIIGQRGNDPFDEVIS